MNPIYKDAFDEGTKLNQLIDPDEKVDVAVEIIKMVQQSYEQFPIKILQFYKRYHSSVPYILKLVNKENQTHFGMYFVLGLLHQKEYEKDGKRGISKQTL